MMKLKEFFSELKARNVRKTLAIYLGSALTTIGILKLFAETYGWSTAFMPIVVTLLTCGMASAFVFAWFHGAQGAQKFSRREMALHSLVVVVAALISFQVGGSSVRRIPSSVGKSIAVLPFENMSESKEDEYFSDGITEDILTQLSKIRELSVLSRSAVMRYKKSDMTFHDIAGELGAATILTGSVRREGNRVRISARLIEPKTNEHLWADSYDREMENIFAIQTEVAQSIARALRAQLSPAETDRIEKKPTQNLEAYGLYLRGKDFYYRHVKEDNEYAIELFKKALALDSTYALAYAALADAYVQRYQRYGMEMRWVDSSVALSHRAIALDPNLAEPRKSLAMAYYQKEWYQQSITESQKALELNPNFAAVYSNMGETLDWTGKPDEAILLIKKAMSLQPGRAIDHVKLGSAYSGIGLDSIALLHYRKAMELQPGLVAAQVGIAEILARRDDVSGALRMLDSALVSRSDDPVLLSCAGTITLRTRNYSRAAQYYQRIYATSPNYFGFLMPFGFALTKSGRESEADEIFNRSITANVKALENGSEDIFRRYELAQVHAIRKDTSAALKWLRAALPNLNSTFHILWDDPLLENLHTNAEYRRLISSSRARVQGMRERVLQRERQEQSGTASL